MKAPDENSSPDEVTEARRIARLNNFLPDIREQVNYKIETALKRCDRAVIDGRLTPEMAFAAVHEINAYRRMLKSFDVKSKMGISN